MGRFKVYLRLKPVSPGETNISEVQSDTTVTIDPRIGSQKGSALNRKSVRYTFKKIFGPTCSQKEVFRRVALPSIREVLSGKPALIFINGAAGSGKTHTIIGTPEDPGLLPRTLDVLFNSIPPSLQAMKFVFKPDKLNGYDVRLTEDAMIDRQNVLLASGSRIGVGETTKKENETVGAKREKAKRNAWIRRDRWDWEQTKVASDIPEDCRVAVFVQLVEIYNNCVFDLLSDKPLDIQDADRGQPWKNIRHDASKCTYVFGATEIEVENADEAMDIFIQGQAKRQAAHTRLNAESFRGHSIYIVKLVQAPVNERTGELVQEKDFITVTQLNLVDLAGSEGAAADSSLDYSSMCLRSCLNIVRENQLKGAGTKVPYRDSRLTHLFKSFFEGIGGIRMLLCVNPRSGDYAKTLEIMKFSETSEEIKTEREHMNRQLKFVEVSPPPSVEDLYTTAYDMGSTLQQCEDEEESLEFDSLRIEDTTFDATIEDRDTVSFSSAEALHDELQTVISRAAAQEVKYRQKSKILEETVVKLNQVQREKDYFKQRLIDVETQKESIESQLLEAEESLRKVRKQKHKIKMEVQSLRAEKHLVNEDHFSEEKSSSGSIAISDVPSVKTHEENKGENIGAYETSPDRPPERPRRRKHRARAAQTLHKDLARAADETNRAPSLSKSSLSVPETRDRSANGDFAPQNDLISAEASESEKSDPSHVGVMETKERCKIAIEGHPYTRSFVLRKKNRNSFNLKDLFANSRK